MFHQNKLVLIVVSIALALGLLIASVIYFCIRWYGRRAHLRKCVDEHSLPTLPTRHDGFEASNDSSASLTIALEIQRLQNLDKGSPFTWWNSQSKDRVSSASNILKYSYKDIQKATQGFSTILGQGSFGPVYKATTSTGEVVAVKVLASDSKQGDKEFQTEVLLLGRLHHRNLVNLIGYCVEKGKRILIYGFMSNGSLEKLLYGVGKRNLSWDERLQVALDISHAIEYLHEGAVPPVIHRDLKTANILLDHSMRAKVADFGLSKEQVLDVRNSTVKGTYGYMDPAYIATNKFTVKSDIYSFGIVIFELITGIHPQKNLMEYINLAAMSYDGVDEILDRNLMGKCDIGEVRMLAKVAHRCLNKLPRKRPTIAEVSHAILKIKPRHLVRQDTISFASPSRDFS